MNQLHMNWMILLFTLILSFGCKAQNQSSILTNSVFESLIDAYIKNNPEIPNSCKAKPIYQISFKNFSDTLLFSMHATLGAPNSFPPLGPGEVPKLNPMTNKGLFYFNGNIVCIFDYKNSKGYGLYNPSGLIDVKTVHFKDIGSCGYTKYPKEFYYQVTQDSIFLVKIVEGAHLM